MAKNWLQRLFTPPKSKSPWQAMTAGSTNQWARGLEPWGPAITTAAGAIPVYGPFISAGMGLAGMAGGKTGFRGTDYGWGNVGSMLAGGLQGYGLGGIGAGIRGATFGALKGGGNALWPGFKGGMGEYWGATKAPFMKGLGTPDYSSPTGWVTQGYPGKVGYKSTWYGGTGNPIINPSALMITPGGATSAPQGMVGSMLASGRGAGNVEGGTMGWKDWIGPGLAVGAGAAGMEAKPPEFDYQTATERLEANRSILTKYMGDAALELPAAASEEYLRQIKTPIGQLFSEYTQSRYNKVDTVINKSWDDYDKAIDAQFAQAGGIGSSDWQRVKNEAQQLRTRELQTAYQEIQDQVFKEQIFVKQDALARAIQNGQWDMNLALELAKLNQTDQQLMMALESQDYEAFQKIMANLFQFGLETTYSSMFPNQRMNIGANLAGGGTR